MFALFGVTQDTLERDTVVHASQLCMSMRTLYMCYMTHSLNTLCIISVRGACVYLRMFAFPTSESLKLLTRWFFKIWSRILYDFQNVSDQRAMELLPKQTTWNLLAYFSFTKANFNCTASSFCFIRGWIDLTSNRIYIPRTISILNGEHLSNDKSISTWNNRFKLLL